MFGFAYPPLEDLDDLADPVFNYMTSLDNLSGRSRGGGHCLSGTRYSAGVAEPATTKGACQARERVVKMLQATALLLEGLRCKLLDYG